MLRHAVLALPLLLLSTPAFALDTWMWGIGPRLGTQVLPGRYPAKLPKEKGGDAQSGPRIDDGIGKFQHDLMLGAEGVYYMDRYHRIGFTGGVGVGLAMGDQRRFTDWSFLLTYDYAVQGRALDVLFGGGLGAGTHGFRGADDQTLRVNTFPLRGEITGLARDDSRAYQLTLFLQYNLASRTIYTTADGDQPSVTGGIWVTSGVELAVLFGDFDPPKGTPSPVRRTPPPADDDAPQ
jgi:hypothetical protein